MDPDKRERLRKNHLQLKQDLNPVPILDHLYQEGILSEDECQSVRCKTPTSEQNHCLLDIIKRKGNKGYDVFCQTLSSQHPHLLKILDETQLDQGVTGTMADVNIFFDPSEDFEMKGLIDQLTHCNKITPVQLGRMKSLVIGETGCPEEIIETKDTVEKFLRHLMKTRILSRYNLAFLQSLLWRVDLKSLCEDVAKFAQSNIHHPIHFYQPNEKAGNGFKHAKFHIRGDLANFKGVNIEDICHRVSRYLGLPHGLVIPAGVEPSQSLVLTIMIPISGVEFLLKVEDFSWLTEFGVDCIMIDDRVIKIQDEITEISTGHLLEQELRTHMESEKMSKQCLYEEQMSNENLKDMLRSHEEELQSQRDALNEQVRWNGRMFAALMVSLHYLAEYTKYRRALQGEQDILQKQKQIQEHFTIVVERAKRATPNPQVIQEVVDAATLLRIATEQREIDNLHNTILFSISALQANFQEAITYRMTERILGIQVQPPPVPSLQNLPREIVVFLQMVVGLTQLEPLLQEIVHDLGSKIDENEMKKVCQEYKIPLQAQSLDLGNKVYELILLLELDKKGSLSNEDIDRVMEAALRATGRKDLWREFIFRNRQRLQIHADRQKSSESQTSRQMTDMTERLDKIEKMLQTMASQNLLGNMGKSPYESNGSRGMGFSGLPFPFKFPLNTGPYQNLFQPE